MTKDSILNEYFEWMYDLVCGGSKGSYRKLLYFLFDTKFRYSITLDGNREDDGIELRYRFGHEMGYPYSQVATILDSRECSILEMMVALSIRCEESIMDDPDIGNRTGQWFGEMLYSLGLSHMRDPKFDESYADYIVQKFLDREYEPNGEGGLFTLKHPRRDMRRAEIWYQMMWYLDEVLEEN